MKRTRKKHNAVFKAKGRWRRRSGDRTIAALASEFGAHPNEKVAEKPRGRAEATRSTAISISWRRQKPRR